MSMCMYSWYGTFILKHFLENMNFLTKSLENNEYSLYQIFTGYNNYYTRGGTLKLVRAELQIFIAG